jgi:uncharacterized DUF497 family protein
MHNRFSPGAPLTAEDDRHDYGETRYETLGLLNERHVISMRKANEREKRRYDAQLE